MGLEGGAQPRSKRRRNRLARTGAVFLVVAAAEGLLIATLDLTGRTVRAPPTAIETIPNYLTTERPPRSRPTAQLAERRPSRKRKAEASRPARPSPPAPSVTAPVPAAPPTPDYGRWTVAPGAWPRPETGRHGIVLSVCDPTRLASLPPEARKACAERLRRASAFGPPVRRGAPPDWKTHSPLSCAPKNEPAHRVILDHCSPVGGTAVGFTLKYKF